MKVLWGKPVAESILQRVKEYAAMHPLRFVIMQVGDDEASKIYVRRKLQTAQQCGIAAIYEHLPADIKLSELQKKIATYNADPSVQGIIVQLPLPETLPTWAVLEAVSPSKDIDGLHPCNVGLLAQGRALWVAATPTGIAELLRYYQVPLKGEKVVIIGRGNLVGTPLALLFSRPGYDATVTLCHSKSGLLQPHLQGASVVVVAAGVPQFLSADDLPENITVVDVGIHRHGNTLVGDVHPSVYEKVRAYTPVPGGVGPLTVAALLENLCKADAYQRGTTYRPVVP